MPIKISKKVTAISYDKYHLLDYEVMSIVFSIHKKLGRFWNEKIYQNELAYRCKKAGFDDVSTEVGIHVSYKTFLKVYYIDLLVNNIIYELKTVQTLSSEHERQTINYLMLTGLKHAKLINFRPPSVQSRFVSTNIAPTKRYDFTIIDDQWLDLNEDSVWLKDILKSLVDEWGIFLEINIFYDAITHFRGGKEKVLKKIEVKDGLRVLGEQKVHLLSPDITFKITALTKDDDYYETQLYHFMHHTLLKAIHWINFNHDKVIFKTLLK